MSLYGVGLFVGLPVGLVEGLFVGLPVGLFEGLFVGLPVGLVEGLLVGLPVGLVEGLLVGLPVGESVAKVKFIIPDNNTSQKNNLPMVPGLYLIIIILVIYSVALAE